MIAADTPPAISPAELVDPACEKKTVKNVGVAVNNYPGFPKTPVDSMQNALVKVIKCLSLFLVYSMSLNITSIHIQYVPRKTENVCKDIKYVSLFIKT